MWLECAWLLARRCAKTATAAAAHRHLRNGVYTAQLRLSRSIASHQRTIGMFSILTGLAHASAFSCHSCPLPLPVFVPGSACSFPLLLPVFVISFLPRYEHMQPPNTIPAAAARIGKLVPAAMAHAVLAGLHNASSACAAVVLYLVGLNGE